MNIKGRVKSLTAALEKKQRQFDNKFFAISENDHHINHWLGKIGDHCDAKGYADVSKDDWELDDLLAFTENDEQLAGYFLEYFKRANELWEQIRKEMAR